VTSASASAFKAEVEAAEAKVTEAYTTKPVIEGAVSLEDRIKEAYREYSEMKIQLGKDKENLDLQYKTSYLWTRYQKMNAALEAAEVAEKEANPEAARAKEAAL
jgi:regulator of replication initiation timing